MQNQVTEPQAGGRDRLAQPGYLTAASLHMLSSPFSWAITCPQQDGAAGSTTAIKASPGLLDPSQAGGFYLVEVTQRVVKKSHSLW